MKADLHLLPIPLLHFFQCLRGGQIQLERGNRDIAGFDRAVISAFFDNPGGTQIAKPSLERINKYLLECNANHEGAFATSVASDAILHEAHQAMADFYDASSPDEIVFGNNSGGSGIMVIAATKIIVGNNVLIGSHTMIIDNDFHHSDPRKRYVNEDIPARRIIIEDNVFIGTNCMILKGITIGKNSVIGANSVVITSIPENSIAIGNPCKIVIKKRWDVPKE